MPRVRNPRVLGAPLSLGSGVSAARQPPPWPRVSMTRWTYPAQLQVSQSSGSPRPPPYPMYSTITAPRGAASCGTSSHPLTGSPPNPENVTSNTSACLTPVALTAANTGGRATLRAAASWPDQNSSKSAGSATSGT